MLVNGQRNAHTDDASIHAGRYTSAMAHGSLVAAKSVSDLGDTVTTVVISNDKMLFAAGSINKKAVVCRVKDGACYRDSISCRCLS